MSIEKSDLFKAFGELLYAIASSDGAIQKEEKIVLTQLIAHHNYAFEIIATFKDHANNVCSVEAAYTNAMKTFRAYGYFEGYKEFRLIMQELAIACNGVSKEEKLYINNFIKELQEHL